MTPILKPGATAAGSVGKVDPELRKAAQGFEAILLREVIGTMRKARLGEDIFGSSATDQFRTMSDERTADQIALSGSLGIAALLEAQFARAGTTP